MLRQLAARSLAAVRGDAVVGDDDRSARRVAEVIRAIVDAGGHADGASP